ncbi:High affinity Ca2+/Mn2+ P-type ATPase-like protein [Nowakowskiella sp. JEL0407]|nr:High affinity Ca2+/Mn2+ P-type ATPase-like protein [Nowakowskiella sp. JEL0407]
MHKSSSNTPILPTHVRSSSGLNSTHVSPTQRTPSQSMSPRSSSSPARDTRPISPIRVQSTSNLSMSPQLQPKDSTSASAIYATLTTEQSLTQLNSNTQTGLTSQEAIIRTTIHGKNELNVKSEETMVQKFIEQFKNPMILLLFGSAAISLLMGQYDDAISITLAITIVVTVAFVQEYRSEQSLEALNQLVPHYCRVLRDSHQNTILASGVVPGDIVLFGTGDRIPADIRILTAVDLEIDESSLTGEPIPCKKHTQQIENISPRDLPLADRANIGFMGTLVRNGHGTGVVVAISHSTEFGVVFSMMKEVEVKRTPLQNKMDELGKQLSFFSFGIIGVILLVGVFQGRGILEMFTIGVSLAVAAIPEGLPIVVTVTLALGVLRMAKRHVIMKKLPSVEGLGSVNVVCVDKTGTLTMNQMTVTKFYVATMQSPVDVQTAIELKNNNTFTAAIKLLLRIGNLCNNSHPDETGRVYGQPTEVALMDLLRKMKCEDERKNFKRISEIPFNPDRKWMAVLCRDNSTSPTSSPTLHSKKLPSEPQLYYLKGALESILEKCSKSIDKSTEFTSVRKDVIKKHAREIAGMGLRVLAFAVGNGLDDGDMTFVGYVGMHDPPRDGVRETVGKLVSGGVKVVMITGDSDDTALSIAKNVGIPLPINAASGNGLLSGSEIDNILESTSHATSEHNYGDIHQNSLADVINNVSVFYRTTPKHKMAIVRAYQAKGFVVAMTGDGVNDAPALRLADIGISMGKSGTDVSREAADMILVNDDMSAVLYAIEEGKCIYYNIQNFLRFQLSTSISALTLIAWATFLGLKNPLNAMQILWINIICDGPVAQSLGVEAVDPDIMRKPPRTKDQPIVTRSFILRVLSSAVVIVVGTLYVFSHEMHAHVTKSRSTTMTFTTFVFFDMFNSLACRSTTRSIFSIGILTNKMYNFAVLACVFGQLLVIYTPFFQQIFQTEALSLYDLVEIVVISSSVLWVDEFRKWRVSEGRKGNMRGSGRGFNSVWGRVWSSGVGVKVQQVYYKVFGTGWQRVPTTQSSVQMEEVLLEKIQTS